MFKLFSLLCVGLFSFGNISANFSLPSVVKECLSIEAQDDTDTFTLEFQDKIFEKSGSAKWVTVNQKIGAEQIVIEFPKKPTIIKKDGLFFAIIKENGTEYSFLAPLPAVGSVDANTAFDLFITQVSKNLTSLDYTIVHENNLEILNLSGFDTTKGDWCKVKIIITPYNFYTMAVLYHDGKPNQLHDKFLNSFSLKKE